ncbi:MAG: ABC transporter permease subunit [Acidimicrobiales bacterium]
MTAQHRELLVRALRALRRSTLGWGIGIVVFAGITVAFWPSLEESDALASFSGMSDGLLEAFGAQNIATPAGYLDGQMFALMLPLLLSGMAIAMVTALTSGDEDAGRLELLHALPVSRRSIWLGRFAAVVIMVALTAAATSILMALSLRPFSLDEVSAAQITVATFACAVLGVFHAAVGFAIGGSGGSRGTSVGLTVLVLMAGYIASFVLPIAPALEGARKVSPWYWALGSQPVTDGVQAPWFLLLVAATVVLVAVGAIAVDRRDIRSA